MTTTKKAQFLSVLKGDDPHWLGDPWKCFVGWPFGSLVMDPITLNSGRPRPGDTGKKDWWGVTWNWPEGEPGAMPDDQPEKLAVPDIAHWEDSIEPPDLSKIDWTESEKLVASLDRENYLVMVPMFTGMFEFSHHALGFENALVDYVTEPEAMYSFLSMYTDWKIEAFDLINEHIHPDIIHSHDDWGSRLALFLSPEMWREEIKPHFERFYGHVKATSDVLIQHHADCYCEPIVGDMVELGIDMWQGVVPTNNIARCSKAADKRMGMLGGIDQQMIDRDDATDEQIIAEVRRAVDAYAPLGNFFPSLPSVEALHPHVTEVVNHELDSYCAKFVELHSS